MNYTGTFCAGGALGRQVGLNAESIDGGQQKMSSPFELTDPQIEETDRTEFLSLPSLLSLWKEIAFSITSRALTGNFHDRCIQKVEYTIQVSPLKMNLT